VCVNYQSLYTQATARPSDDDYYKAGPDYDDDDDDDA